MNTLDLTGLGPAVATKIAPFVDEMLRAQAANIHSVHIVGSAVTPDYIEKRSDINSVVKLQDSLEGTENRISVERKRYNDVVRELNTYRRTVFGRFFASLAGVGEAQYYEVPEAEKEVPKVKF